MTIEDFEGKARENVVEDFFGEKRTVGGRILAAIKRYLEDRVNPDLTGTDHYELVPNGLGEVVITPRLTEPLVRWLNGQLKSNAIQGIFKQENKRTVFDPFGGEAGQVLKSRRSRL